jgi:hypothetical protein
MYLVSTWAFVRVSGERDLYMKHSNNHAYSTNSYTKVALNKLCHCDKSLWFKFHLVTLKRKTNRKKVDKYLYNLI